MVLTRTAKSCGSDAPMLASSLREEAQATVSNKRGHRGEREVSRKPIARGMPGRSVVTVVTMLVCLFYFAYEAAGASSARHSLRPLFRRARDSCTARSNSRRGNAKVWLMNANGPDSHSSSPGLPPSLKLRRAREIACPVEALAQTGPGDPVFHRRLRIIERPRRTGSSGQAGRRQLCGKRQGNHHRRPCESTRACTHL